MLNNTSHAGKETENKYDDDDNDDDDDDELHTPSR